MKKCLLFKPTLIETATSQHVVFCWPPTLCSHQQRLTDHTKSNEQSCLYFVWKAKAIRFSRVYFISFSKKHTFQSRQRFTVKEMQLQFQAVWSASLRIQTLFKTLKTFSRISSTWKKKTLTDFTFDLKGRAPFWSVENLCWKQQNFLKSSLRRSLIFSKTWGLSSSVLLDHNQHLHYYDPKHIWKGA